MTNIGIDAIDFYVPPFAISLETLAQQRNVDPNKYLVGLGQEQMAVLPPDEDIVSMAANAAHSIISQKDKHKIRLLLFATESGVDQSKAAGLWVHHLLELDPSCRIVELKQACYSATCALQLATSYIKEHVHEKVLLIAADNARYGLHTSGEPTQGCGAVAMLISMHPRIFSLDSYQGVCAIHTNDFFRPNYSSEAFVDGKYSTKIYLQTLAETWKQYTKKSHRSFEDHSRFCYHIPFTKMAEKAHERLVRTSTQSKYNDMHFEQIRYGLEYARKMGNTYTAALYIGLLSLLENDSSDLANARIGLFSYGSGSVGEFFSGTVCQQYKKHLPQKQSLFLSRTILSCAEYEQFFTYTLPVNGSTHQTPQISSSLYRFSGINNHIRHYEKTRTI